MAITKKQMDVFRYLMQYQEKNGHAPTQKEIKEYFGLKSFGSVQRYLKYLEDEGMLEKDWNARRGLKLVNSEPPTKKSTKTIDENQFTIPLLGKIAAGNPISAIEEAGENVVVPPSMLSKGHTFYALKVKGDSMIEDGIKEGDLAIIRYQEMANNGETVVAIINGEATLKNYYLGQGQIELRPANSRYKPIKVSPKNDESEQFKLAGVMVGLIRHCLK